MKNKTADETKNDEKELEILIVEILRDIGIPRNIQGYRYVKEAINLAVHDESYLDQVTKKLYPELANKFGGKWHTVERNIRHALDVAWARGNLELQDKIFGYTIDAAKGKPTNSEFIAGVTEFIRMCLKYGKDSR